MISMTIEALFIFPPQGGGNAICKPKKPSNSIEFSISRLSQAKPFGWPTFSCPTRIGKISPIIAVQPSQIRGEEAVLSFSVSTYPPSKFEQLIAGNKNTPGITQQLARLNFPPEFYLSIRNSEPWQVKFSRPTLEREIKKS
ncbi:hypothetical protein ABW19_dt0209772 [Dactylella cylindrospora]|nr:hypothetical protein ABW19_dt0209772 [Dactylella cylindrospora]